MMGAHDELVFGPLRGVLHEASVRWLVAQDTEVLRMIGVVIRDQHWRTPAPLPGSLRVQRSARRTTLAARTPMGRAALDWRLDLVPTPTGLVATATLEARGNVRTNRSGLVLLLPCDRFAGARYRATHTAGTTTRGRLPRAVASHCPVADLAALETQRFDGLRMRVSFEGETFEMEDQRNWIDPTFKIYSRALSRPFPYRLRDGQRVVQRAAIHVESSRPPSTRAARRPPRRGRLPDLGVACREDVPVDPATMARLSELAPSFVFATSSPFAPAAGAEIANQLSAELRVEAISPTVEWIDSLAVSAPGVAYLHRSDAPAHARLRTVAPTCEIGGGTFADFVMINRHGIGADAERLTFALCPTVHARDDRMLIETLDALPDVFAAARRLAGARPIDIGPCSLRRRLHPLTARPAILPRDADGRPADVDRRQGELIAAAWLATLVAIAATSGIASVCTFDIAGARGLVGVRERFPLPVSMTPGAATPAHGVLAAFGRRPRASLIVHAVDPFTGAAFTFADQELWLVDLSGRSRHLNDLPDAAPIWVIAASGRWKQARPREALAPFGIVRAPIPRPRHAGTERIVARWVARTGAQR